MGPHERVLITSRARLALVSEWSRRASSGSVIVLVEDRAALAQARQEYADFVNVMATPGHRGDIPWGDRRFTLILDESPTEPSAEMLRVLSPEGTISAL